MFPWKHALDATGPARETTGRSTGLAGPRGQGGRIVPFADIQVIGRYAGV